MLIEIAGVSTSNKGAELMLVAIQEHFAAVGPDIQFAVDPQFGVYEERAGYRLRTMLPRAKIGRSRLASWLMPASFRRVFGLVAERDVDAVLDASGFAFGDQLGPDRTERFAEDVERWKESGKRVVLLPQALGPFQTPRVRQAFVRVLRAADLVVARDRVSFQHIADIGVSMQRVRLAPDITTVLPGLRDPGLVKRDDLALIVPNHRMIEKTSEADQAAYLPTLARCVSELHTQKLSAAILLHDAAVDEQLVEPLQRLLPAPLPVIRERDPRRLKGILSSAAFVIGSRFHALLGALSHGVPCLALGWSHKYITLLEDFCCTELLLTPGASDESIRGVVGRIVAGASRQDLVGRLAEAGATQRLKVEMMWQEIESVLGLHSEAPRPGSRATPSDALSRQLVDGPAARASRGTMAPVDAPLSVTAG